MSSTPIKYTGSYLDYSGYGSANRAFIASLYLAGVDITTERSTHVADETTFGWEGQLCKDLENRDVPYKIKMIHLTPDLYPKYMEEGKYHIGKLFWETTKLPKEWIEPINKMGEIWTSSENMAYVFKDSGVRVPVYWFPQPINISNADKDWGEFAIRHHKGFLFYSIFQWIKRKNPKALITAYWETFQGRNDVSLLIKTHRVNFDNSEFDKIKEDIRNWQLEKVQKHYPRILLCKRLLKKEDMMRLHNTGDCYIQTDRGEGFSRTVMEALLLGKPVISTARGGIHEYLDKSHYFRIPSKYVPVEEEGWISWYKKNQKWAEINQEKLKTAMLYVYQNKEMAEAKGLLGKSFIKDNFSYHKIGQKMRERLIEIYKGL